MTQYSTQQVAKKLDIGMATLTRYIQAGKVPAPKTILAGAMRIRLWTDEEVERVRALLPKIANGRKTRYQKLREKEKAQPTAAVPHKQQRPKKK
jgi:predicted site-specific integrase-resolvase